MLQTTCFWSDCGLALCLRVVTTWLAFENIFLLQTDVAGMPRYLSATGTKFLKWPEFFPAIQVDLMLAFKVAVLNITESYKDRINKNVF